VARKDHRNTKSDAGTRRPLETATVKGAHDREDGVRPRRPLHRKNFLGTSDANTGTLRPEEAGEK